MNKSSIYSFLIAVLSSAVAYALLIVSKKYLNDDLQNSDILYSSIAIAIFIFIVLYSFIKAFGWSLAKKIYSEEIYTEGEKIYKIKHQEIMNKHNILEVFPSMDHCINEICDKLSTEKNVSIFVQIGREILSGKGIFYECLKKNSSPESIRILHSSVRTPYLSSKQASSRSVGKLEEWRLDLVSSEQSGKQLSNIFNEGVFQSRAHHEGYYWRVFLFDEMCYVQPYIYDSDNSGRAPVFKIKKSDSSVYNTYSNYFEKKWIEYEPNTYYINDFIKESFPVSVTAILKFDSLYIFSIPDRYVRNNNMYIQAVGGKTEGDENYKTALKREVGEEIDASIKIYSSRNTTYIHEGGIQLAEPFHDTPAPYIIYRRDVLEDTRDKRVKWILLYQAELLINSIQELRPKNETRAIICLSQKMLTRLSDPTTSLKLRDIMNAKDGSCLIANKSYSPETVLHPRGMVSVISTSSYPSFGWL